MNKFEKEKKKLLSAKTPEQYIDLSHRSGIQRARKSAITREWLEKTGHTISDIQYARNRHPHWKKLKATGSYERTSKRIEMHNYSTGNVKIYWNKDLVSTFYDLNKKGLRDYELAKEFKTTLPAVNHIRRKLNFAGQILEKEKGSKPTKTAIVKLALSSEPVLKQRLKELGVNGKTSSKK